MTHDELLARLERKVLGPDGQGSRAVFLTDVRDSVGMAGNRTADAVSLGLWPSRGLLLEGYEVKVRRRDWLDELRRPEKAEAVARYCDRWWLVVDRGVVAEDEVPTNWGLMATRSGGLTVVRDAPSLDPEDAPREFVASLLRRAVRLDLTALRQEVAENARARVEAEANWKRAELERDAARGRELQAEWDGFKERVGESFGSWMLGFPDEQLRRVADVVVAAQNADREAGGLRRQLEASERRTRGVADLYRRAAEALDD